MLTEEEESSRVDESGSPDKRADKPGGRTLLAVVAILVAAYALSNVVLGNWPGFWSVARTHGLPRRVSLAADVVRRHRPAVLLLPVLAAPADLQLLSFNNPRAAITSRYMTRNTGSAPKRKPSTPKTSLLPSWFVPKLSPLLPAALPSQ